MPLGGHIERVERAAALSTCGAVGLIEASTDDICVRPVAAGGPPAHTDADFLKLTSGTTAAPRAIRFRAHQLVADCDHICASMGIGADDLNFGVIPFSHSYGFSNLITPLLCRGVPLVASNDRMPRAILSGLARSGATVFPAMPIFLQKLVELDNVPDLSRLRLCISAGAVLPRSLAVRFEARFGLKVHSFYGSSECGGIGYDTAGDCPGDGFVGTPMKGVTIDALPDGRIAVGSPAVGEGYFPHANTEVLGFGRFIPGDVISWSERGMTIVGRATDVINVAGRKLNPHEVEQRMLECPGVRQVVVFGVPSAARGEEAVACVVGDEISAPTVIEFCHRRLSQWQVPRDVWIVPEIVVNERGKISRRLLAERYLAERIPK